MLNEDTHLQRATKNKGVKAILHIAIERRKHSFNGFCCLANGIAIKKCCVFCGCCCSKWNWISRGGVEDINEQQPRSRYCKALCWSQYGFVWCWMNWIFMNDDIELTIAHTHTHTLLIGSNGALNSIEVQVLKGCLLSLLIWHSKHRLLKTHRLWRILCFIACNAPPTMSSVVSRRIHIVHNGHFPLSSDSFVSICALRTWHTENNIMDYGLWMAIIH